MDVHECLDVSYGPHGDDKLRAWVESGGDLEARGGRHQETPLHVATRRRRSGAVEILLDAGADIDARTRGHKTAYAHAVRRGFDEVADLLRRRGADVALNAADRFAVAVVRGRLDSARRLLRQHPETVRTGNPEEDRLLADVAGRPDPEPVALLIEAGADLAATGLDDGTALHQACWFGQPQNARLLIDGGAALEVFDATHESSPLGWVAHGCRYSGGAEQAQDAYVELADLLLESGASLYYPGDTSDSYRRRLLADATPRVAEILRRHGA